MTSRRTRRLLLILALILLLITTLPSLLGRLLMQQQLRTMGAERVDVRVFHLNLWNGRFTLKGLRADRLGRPQLVVDELIADIDYGALPERRLHLDELTLSGVSLPLREQQGQWQLGPLDLPIPSEPEPETEPHSPSTTEWRWGLSNLALAQLDARLHYQDSDHRLILQQLTLPRLYQWDPELLSQLVLRGELNGSPFAIDSDSRPLSPTPRASAQIRVEQLDLGPLLALWQPGQQGVISTDINLSFEQPDADRLLINSNGNLELTGLSSQLAAVDAQLKRLHWQGTTRLTVATGQLQQLHNEGRLNLTALSAEQNDLTTQLEQLVWQGINRLTLDGGELQQADTEGELTLNRLQLRQGSAENAQLALSTDLSLSLKQQLSASGANLSLSQTSDLRLTDWRFSQPALTTAGKQLHWQGSSQQQLADKGLTQLDTNGQLQLRELALQQPDLALNLKALLLDGKLLTDLRQLSFNGRLNLADNDLQAAHLAIKSAAHQWQGTLRLNLEDAALQQLQGQYQLQQLALAAKDQPARLRLNHLQLENFDVDPDLRLQANALTLEGLQLQGQSPLLELASLRLDQLQAGASATRINQVTLGAIDTRVLLDEQQQPRQWLDWLAQLQGPAGQAEAQPANEPAAKSEADNAPYPFALKKLTLTAPLVITAENRQLPASRPMTLAFNQLQLEAIDTRSDAPTRFQFDARLNRFGSLKGEGAYSLFASSPDGRWQLTAEQLELPPFSPYMNRFTGYQVSNGQLHLTSKGELGANQLKSSNRVVLNQFEVEKGPKADASGINEQLGMPLELAVAILTDDDDNVTLDIPVTGSLDDPKFGIQSVVNILMAKAAKQGAMSYLSHMLQPYGALLSLGKMALDAADKAAIGLQPVTFPAGSTELDDQGRDYLGKLNELLTQRKALRLKLCGYSTMDDATYIDQLSQQIMSQRSVPLEQILTSTQRETWLHNLAAERGEQVKEHLSETLGVDGKRLFSCLPRTDLKKADDKPRVQIGL